MKVVDVRNIKIGEGKPKICLPIVGKTNEEIMSIAKSFENLEYDLVEFRVDFYERLKNQQQLIHILKELRSIIDKPILCTYRSLKEGGQVQLSNQEYIDFVNCVCMSGCIDIVDIELMSGDELVLTLTDIAHKNHVYVIMSHHNFDKTPDSNVLQERIEKMEELGGDILKIAMMPQTKEDVMRLLSLTYSMSLKVNHPLVTMSMGQLGVISRICGSLTGSAMTFASAGKASAPGQIAIEDMCRILEVLQ